MTFKIIIFMAMSLTLARGQRPSFAGSRPIGYPEVERTTTEGLDNRYEMDLQSILRSISSSYMSFWIVLWSDNAIPNPFEVCKAFYKIIQYVYIARVHNYVQI
jgi:hypothetical protein